MHGAYKDITSRLGEPLWWDEYAVPRYDIFAPSLRANIYADELALIEIACQGCGQQFRVAMSQSKATRLVDEWPRLAEEVRDGSIHYGDPPNYDCCPAGATMNCDDLRILEFWDRFRMSEGNLFDTRGWTRRPELEITLPDIEEDRGS